MTIPNKRLIVIGGGPAGLMAAGQAALRGANVTLLEKNERPARKLLLTGNGRCNLTNTLPLDEFIRHFGRNGKFLRHAFSSFFSAELIGFFDNLGVKVVSEKNGRVYPRSNRASDIADSLIDWTVKSGVKINYRSTAGKIIINGKHVSGVQLNDLRNPLPADAVIIATGGASYPLTGSTGDGYRLAESLGHTIIPIRPASVPLVIADKFIARLKGVRLKSVTIKLKSQGKKVSTATGDLLFTHYGISGPAVLAISGICVDELKNGHQPYLSIDLASGYNEEKLDRMLLQSLKSHGKSQLHTILKDFIPDKMAILLLSLVDIEPTKLCSQISAAERRKIILSLKQFDLKVKGHRPLAEAMVTAGGICLDEVNPRTMESRLIDGLYFAGEVLDLDADTGGFNLQAAFSTGWLAGRECSMSPDQ